MPQTSHTIGARGSGAYEQYLPVLIVEERCSPREGFAPVTFAMADLIALVTFSLARSACEAAFRSLPPERGGPPEWK